MKLREFKFNSISERGLSIFVGEKEVSCGFIGDVLREITPLHLEDMEIKSTNSYFDSFVIRL